MGHRVGRGWAEGEWPAVDTVCVVPGWSLDGLSVGRFEKCSTEGENGLNNGVSALQ